MATDPKTTERLREASGRYETWDDDVAAAMRARGFRECVDVMDDAAELSFDDASGDDHGDR
jgi:hypothetical protein